MSLTSVVVLACALAVNAQLLSSTCANTHIGSKTETLVELQSVNLGPGIADWEVKIPDVPQCPNGIQGAKATVCDFDLKPVIRFVDLNLLFVHRTGSCAGYASVKIIVFCKENPWNVYNQHQSNDGSVPPPVYNQPRVYNQPPQNLIVHPY